jgi:predicted porin
MKADGFSPFGISGTVGGGGGVSEMTRLDNSVKYLGKFGNVNVVAAYALGGAGGIADANSGYALNVGYDNGVFGAQVVWSAFRNVIKESNTTWSVTAPYYLKGTLYDANDLTVALKAKATDDLTLKGGFEHLTLEKASRQLSSTSVVDGMLYGIPTTFASYADGDQKVDIYFLGGEYKVTPRLVVAAGYYDMSFDSWKTAAGLSVPSGGVKDAVAIVDYTLGKNTDWYVAYMHSDLSGQKGASAISTSSGAASPNFSSNSILGSGLRFKF